LQTYELSGEPPTHIFPAAVTAGKLADVEVLRIVGTRADVAETTRLVDELWPGTERTTLGDAQFLYYARDGKDVVEIYELIVLRKVAP
jgi:hypothetical protein